MCRQSLQRDQTWSAINGILLPVLTNRVVAIQKAGFQCFFILAFAGICLATPTARQNGQTLSQLATSKGKYFGTAVQASLLTGNPTYSSLAQSEFNMFTPENEMKWSSIEPERGVFNFGPVDEIFAFAEATGSRVRGHNICWDQQTPEYVTNITDPTELLSVLEEHISAVLGRYKGRTFAFDIVNEPISDNSDGSLQPNVWLNVLGPSYIATALTLARQADPDVKLYINDFSIEDVNTKSTALLNLVEGLLADGVPLDGIGFESHFIGGEFPGDIAASMQRFTDLGLEVALTELDVRLPVPDTSAELATQASNYASAVSACLGNANCPGVTVWEFSDAFSWVPGAFPGQGAADLYDENFVPKPAFTSVAETL